MTPSKKTSEKDKDLLVKIAYHEAYSTAYKLKLAKSVIAKTAVAVGKATAKGGKFVKRKLDERKNKKSAL
ncbi:MAG: hypothetical protein LCH34_02865 [Firmicutes bacterium]|nr:hypothetical protein [Bacillota bacterium]